MAEIAVFIKTIFRDAALYNCIASVRRHMGRPTYRLYVADDGIVDPPKAAFYRALRDEGHVVLELPFDMGASRSRNLLLDRLGDEKYVLRMDDDFELTEETRVDRMKEILERCPDLGAIAGLERQIGVGKGVMSGEISGAQGFLERRGSTLVKRMVPLERFEYRTAGGLAFARCDFTRNLLLIRREVFEDVRWEERLRFAGEHADFLLQLQASRWNLGFTTASIHLHREDLPVEQGARYRTVRAREAEDFMQVYREKWGVEKISYARGWRSLLKSGLVKLRRAVAQRR